MELPSVSQASRSPSRGGPLLDTVEMRDDPKSPEPSLGRRAFLGRTGAAAFGLGVAGLPSVERLRAGSTEPPAVVGASPGPDAAPLAVDLREMSLAEMAVGISSGRLTSRMLVEGYLDRIERIDRRGPTINSILEVNPDVLALADALDQELREKGPRGPLHGIPVLVKDNIGTGDRMHTSAGSLALANFRAPEDAFVVQKLREAGCVILGKANMSEWANARGRASIGGWSGRGRLSRNPFMLDRSTGGSSSGTAAAVSANLVAAAVGTETMGSIVNPASLCGVVGMKPTVGLVSRTGIIPVSFTQDTAGPMGRTVRDVAILLSAMAVRDPADDATAGAPQRIADYTSYLDPDSLRGARIGVARSHFGWSLHADRVAERALESLRGAGAVLVDPVELPEAGVIWSFDAEVLSYELKASLNAWFQGPGRGSAMRSLADLIEFNLRHSDQELTWFGQETFLYAQEKGPLTSPQYLHELSMLRRFSRDEGIDAALREHRLDALVAPTQSPAWLIDVLLGDNSVLGGCVLPAAAGYPSISVPAGEVSDLPVGLLFMGPAWSEERLLGYAFAFEQRTRARRSPAFRPTIEACP
jgi:amidase